MKKYFIIKTFYFRIVFVILSTFLISYSKDLKVEFSELVGDWLIKEYMDEVVKSKLPVKSGKFSNPEYFFIEEENGKYFWNLISGFHDGIGPKELYQIKHNKKNVFDLILLYANGKDTAKNKWEITSEGSFKSISILGEPFTNEENVYIKINEGLNCFINKHTISGTYYDNKNSRYEYSLDGNATWPKRKFKYEVELDNVFPGDEAYEILGEKDKNDYPLRHGFKINFDTLFLFHVNYFAEGLFHDSIPFKILIRK